MTIFKEKQLNLFEISRLVNWNYSLVVKYFQIFEKFGEIFPSEQQVDQTRINEFSPEESRGGQLQKQVKYLLL